MVFPVVETISKHIQCRNNRLPYSGNFLEEHLKQARERKAIWEYNWLAYRNKSTQATMHTGQSNVIQAMKERDPQFLKIRQPVILNFKDFNISLTKKINN